MFKASKLIIFLLLSCSLQKHSPIPNEKLSPAEIKEDLKVLTYALKKTYAGQFFAPGMDMKEFYRQIRKVSKKSNREDFYLKLKAIFATLPDQSISINKSLSEDFQPLDQKWELQKVNINKKKGLFLKVQNFSSLNSPYWDQLANQFEKEIKNSEFLVLDLRNSSGDDDSVGIYFARYFNGGVLRHPIIRQHHIRSKESLRLLKNYWKLKKPNQDFPFPSYQKGESKILPIEFRRDSVAYSKKYTPGKSIYLLVDESCKKPCETTLYGLEKNPNSFVLGRRTKGQIHFGHPGLLLLPHSKLSVLIPTSYNEFADGRFAEKRGYQPKFNCEDSKGLAGKMMTLICKTYW